MAGVIDLNEVAGAKATHQYARMSASKARAVLDLIRDLDLDQAREELQFCDRRAAGEISKVLNSAVANAEHNENLIADELYVAECWADEGPTLKRWRPRARGRATRINKQTCHITVVVAQLAEEELELRNARLAAKGTSQGASRAARVAASRGDDAEADGPVEDAEAVEEWNAEDADADGEANATDESPYGEGSMAPPADGSIPEGYPVKGNADSMKYHQPDGRWYEQTVAEVYFATVADAEAAGFTEAGASEEADGGDDDAPQDAAEADTADGPVEDAEAVEEWNAEDADADGEANATDESPYGEGSMAPPADGSIPDGFQIKGNADSMKYHQPDGRWYEQTVAEVLFATTEAAEAAGFTEAGKSSDDSSTDEED